MTFGTTLVFQRGERVPAEVSNGPTLWRWNMIVNRSADLIKVIIIISWDSAVGVATNYGLEGPGMECRWGRDFLHPSTPALGPTQPSVQWVPGLYRGWSGQRVVLTTHPHLAPRLKKSRAIPFLSLWAFVACYRVNFALQIIIIIIISSRSIHTYKKNL